MNEIDKNDLKQVGKKKLASDLFWCFWLTMILVFYEKINYPRPESTINGWAGFTGTFLGCFFMFFFWSWKPKHVAIGLGRIVIHLFCGLLALISFYCFSLVLYASPQLLKNHTGIYMFAFYSLILFGVMKKYLNIMYPTETISANDIIQGCLVEENEQIMKCNICGEDAFFKFENKYACRKHEVYVYHSK